MVVNGQLLLQEKPIIGMDGHKGYCHGVSHGLSEVGYDIRLKQTVTFWPGHSVPNLPHRQERLRTVSEYQLVDPITHKVIREEGNLAIASAMEEFSMPDHLMGIVHDKSTWARKGLSVFNTVIEPGWRGFLTLELVYHGQDILTIPAGAGIAQVVFHTVSCSAHYNGKYQDQADEPVAAKLVTPNLELMPRSG